MRDVAPPAALRDQVLAAMVTVRPVRGAGLLTNLVAFGRLLRALHIPVRLSQVLDACHALAHIDVGDREAFQMTLRANLVLDRRHFPIWEEAFQLFWSGAELKIEAEEVGEGLGDLEGPPDGPPGEADLSLEEWEPARKGEGLDREEVAGYSPDEILAAKDFGRMDDAEQKEVARALALLAARIAADFSRRRERGGPSDRIDLRATLRRAARYGGEIVEFATSRPKQRRPRTILLCDVSGSMSLYSQFFLQFLFALQNRWSRIHTFVFSTRLTEVTQLLRAQSLQEALPRLARAVPDWSGGTNIGLALRRFNQDFGRHLVTRRTAVLIVSDGWDRGDVALLAEEMAALRRRCRAILWLNPLLGGPNYEPSCRGMRAALPFVDAMLPVHNLDSLWRVGKTLQRLAA